MPYKMNPFPGLRPFEMQEKYLFFGREDQTVELLKRLGQARFMAVVGTSGSGKSSLVRAGLLPELHGGTMTDAGSSWEIAVMRPGGDPLTNLAKALEDSGIYDTDEDGYYRHLRAMLGRSTMGLIEAVTQSALEEQDNLLIVVDQFEEIFRFRSSSGKHAEEAANFISLLLEATKQTGKSIFVTITMRSDFLGDCSQFRGLAEAVNEGEYLIPRLNRNQRRLAIEGPVKVGGKQIEARLVQQLLNDIGDDPDQLPILQHALMRTWEYHEKDGGGGALDLEHYEATGGMKEALSRHADEVYQELKTDEDRIYCQRIFKALTERVSEGRGIRRPMAMAELAEVVGADDPKTLVPVVEAYRASGRTFLMPPDSIELGPKVVIDISHESLMRVWQHLVVWVDEEAQSARIYRRLADTAQLYRENKAGLYRDPDLQISLAWRDQNNPTEAWADRYYPGYNDAMVFLDESHETAVADEKAREEARKRELEQARRLAEEERRSKSLWQKLVWTFGVAVIAITAGLFYIIESRETIRNNLSRVSLKEANRLANNNQQDEAIALLAKTIEDNPEYSAAGVRLMSMLEHTAFPSRIEKIHSTDNDFTGENDQNSIILYPEYDIFVERGRREDGWMRYRLFNLANGKMIKSWQSEHRLGSGRIIKNGKIFQFLEVNGSKSSKFYSYDIQLDVTSEFEILREVMYGRLTNNADLIEVYFRDGGYSVYSIEQKKSIFEYNAITGVIRKAITMSRDGKKVAMAIETSDRLDIIVFDIQKNESRLMKTYPVKQTNVRLSFTDDSSSLIINKSAATTLSRSRSLELLDLDSGASVDIRPDSDGFWGWPELFLNNGLMVVRESEGGLAMAAYPFDNFSRMEGHYGLVSSTSISNDGMMVASGSEDRTVRLWSTTTGKPLSAPLRFENTVVDVAFDSNDNALYVVVLGGDLYKAALPLRKAEHASYEFVAGRYNPASYDPDQDRIGALNAELLTVVDLKTQKEYSVKIDNAGFPGRRPGVRYFPIKCDWENEEVLFFSTIHEASIVLKSVNYKNKSIRETYALPTGTKRVSLCSFGKRIALVSTNNLVSVINIESKKRIGKPFMMDNTFSTAVLEGDEDLIYGRGWRGLQFYDVKSGAKVGPLIDITGAWVDYLPATRTYVVTSGDSSVVYVCKKKFESITTLDLGQPYQSHGVNSKETLIAVAMEDGNVDIWDLNKGVKVNDSLKHDAEVEGVVFHPYNDRYIFTFMDGGNLYGWDRKDGNVFMGPVSLPSGRGLYINTDGTVLTARANNGRVYRVPVQIPQHGFKYSTWLPGLANSMVGFRIDDSGAHETLNREESLKLRKDAKRIAESGPMANWLNWLIDDSSNLKAAPIGDATRKQIVNDLAESGTLPDLIKALQLSPSNPELMSGFAHQMLLMGGVEEKTKRPATYAIAKARELGEDNAVVFYRSAKIEKILNNQADALKYVDRAIALDSGNAEYSEFKRALLQNN